MNSKDLRPINQWANNLGMKAILYGPPGIGKTPVALTAKNPVALICEPGLMSVRKITNIPAYYADTPQKLDEFFTWFFQKPKERNQFQTLVVDSISQMAEIYLKKELKEQSHGLKAYGNMSTKMMEWLEALFYLPNFDVILIAKQQSPEEGKTSKHRPYFPGNELNIKVPHLFDQVLHFSEAQIPGVGKVPAIRTKSSFDVMARDRSGNLDEFEQPNMTAIAEKIMR